VSESSDLPHTTETHPSAQAGKQEASPRREFIAGFQAELPLLLGVIPFGMIYGALALEAGLSPAAAQAMSAIIFGGSAQFITTQLVAGGAPGLVIILTVAVVNLRHMLYSASVAPYLQHLPLRWKAGLAYLLTDEAYAMAIQHLTTTQGSNKHWFFLGTGLTLWTFWQLSTAAGILLGAVIPESWSLDFTISLTFIALIVPALKDRPSVAAALVAGVTALLAYSMPYRLGIVVAAILGVTVGVLLESRS
jgi:4-azaleucine resistance transporter AzlC